MRDLAQEQALLERIRQGERQARNELLTSLLPSLRQGAFYQFQLVSAQSRDHRIEIDDLVQEAYVKMCERFETALHHPNPCAYLLACGRFAMRSYCRTHRSLVIVPDGGLAWCPDVDSLDVAASVDEKMETLAETLVAPVQQTRKPKFHPFLYLALRALTPAQRVVIEQHYGLQYTEAKPLDDLCRELGITIQAVRQRNYKALAELKDLLAPIYHYQEEPAHPSVGMPQLVSAS